MFLGFLNVCIDTVMMITQLFRLLLIASVPPWEVYLLSFLTNIRRFQKEITLVGASFVYISQ